MRKTDILDKIKLPFGGSALDLDSAQFIWDFLQDKKPKNILEFGSGTSTVIFAHYAKDSGAQVTSLEHLDWARIKTLELLGDMSQYVDLRYAPIKNAEEKEYQTIIPDNIDFFLIDGPPAYGGIDHIGRESTLLQLYPHLAENWIGFVDDAKRDHEKNCLRIWTEQYRFSHQYIDTQKGLLHLYGRGIAKDPFQ